MKTVERSLPIALLFFSACSSTPTTRTSEVEADKVIARIDDLAARPGWVRESEPFKIADGFVTSVGITQIPGDHRVEAAYRIAENNAKAAISSAIEVRMDSIFQNAEEGTAFDTTQARFISAEASKITTSAFQLKGRYWEKVATTTDSGESRTIYKVFTAVQMPEAAFKKAILDAARKRDGVGGISKDFSEKVNQHWDSFVSQGQ